MDPLAWLDLPLLVLGIAGIALSAAWLRRRPGRRGVPAAVLLLGVGCLAAAGADLGLSRWDKVRLHFDPAALGPSQIPFAPLPAGWPAPTSPCRAPTAAARSA